MVVPPRSQAPSPRARVKNTFLEWTDAEAAPRRARSASPAKADEAYTFAGLFSATPRGEYIDPKHPFCAPGPCMHTEGRRVQRKDGRKRPPEICSYRKCLHCHHPDHWDFRRKHPGLLWTDALQRRLGARGSGMVLA